MRLTAILAGVIVAANAWATASDAQGIEDLMASADPEAGESVFRQCKACHTVEKDGANRVGPNLYGIIGKPVASAEGFRYSDALKEHGGEWTLEALDSFLENPRGAIKGTRMSYRGLSDPADRANVIAYLNTFSDDPIEFAAAAGTSASAEAGEESQEASEDFGLLVSEPGVEETYYACTACHSEMIVVQQGKTREDWDDLLVWMVEEQGMSELPADERDVILDYLAAHYNTDRPNFPSR